MPKEKNTASFPTALILLLAIIQGCHFPGPNENTYTSEVAESEILDASGATGYWYKDTVYVPVYSDIYNETKDMRYLLTATLSIRNTSYNDTVVVNEIEYFDTRGRLLKEYLDHPVFLVPMATIEYVIEQKDRSGGSGANFMVNWSAKDHRLTPVIQTVMISVSGQQGVAFSCNGVSVKKERDKGLQEKITTE